MSTTSSHGTTSPGPDLLGKFSLSPHADIILRSCDSHDFRVQKLYLIDSSPVLAEQITAATCYDVEPEATGATGDAETKSELEILLPVVQLPESHATISSLLSFVFPVPPVLSPGIGEIFDLLSMAQKYRMTTALTRIRDCISKRKPKFAFSKTAPYVYTLAWDLKLLEEALLAAEETLKSPMTIHVFEDKLNIISCAALGELWKYRQRVLSNLDLGLGTDFYIYQSSNFPNCVEISENSIPLWLDHYLDSVMEDPACLDITTFHLTLSSHISPPGASSDNCEHCKSIPGENIRKFWTALVAVFHESVRKAESDFSFTRWETRQSSTLAITEALPLPEGLNMQGADVILQSADLISFRVHKSTMAISSPFFSDLFSLPQPPDDEAIDGLPVVHVSEDAEVLHSLLTLLYPIPSVIPDSYEKALAVLAASQKYNMDTVSSAVRCNIALPTTKAAFCAYAIASSKQLIPEMETAARLTLDHPMTFETIADALPLFEGPALQDLICFRKRCRDNLLSFFVDFVDGDSNLSRTWNNCRKTKRPYSALQSDTGVLATWFRNLVVQHITNLQETYTCPFPKSSSLRKEFTEALRSHISQTQCLSCTNLYATEGEAFRDKWLRRVSKARDKEPFYLDTGTSNSPVNLENTDA
ncbi:hypothetical protein EDB89DRAFT_2026160, partial [Lactarius sanguifluus]